MISVSKHYLIVPNAGINTCELEKCLLMFSVSCFPLFGLSNVLVFFKCGPDSLRVVFSLSTGEFVAQFKFTVLLMANGPMRITNGPLEPEFYKSEHEVQDADLKVGRVGFAKACLIIGFS